jgi:outer membrane biosynthesis protein TonB
VRDDVDQAAIAAVRLWRYEPGQADGQTLAVVMTVTVQIPPEAGRQ